MKPEITLQQLIDADACAEQVILFKWETRYTDYVFHVTPENLVKTKLHVWWAIMNGLANLSMQDAVIASGNAEWCYYFARYVKSADIGALQDAVIASGNALYCYRFACDVKGVDVEALQDAIIAIGNAEYCYRFARYIKGANITALQDVVIASGNANYCYYFARDVKGANIEALQDAVIASGNVSRAVWLKLLERDTALENIQKIIDDAKSHEPTINRSRC